MRTTADTRVISFITIALTGTALMVLANLAGHHWASLFIVPLATIAWLETSLRRGRVRGASLAVLDASDERRHAEPTPHNAELFDLAAHRARRTPRQQELAEEHVAPVVTIDFRRAGQPDRIRLGA